jgi:hypothetical protein
MLVESDQSRGSHFIMAIAACQLIFVTCKTARKQPSSGPCRNRRYRTRENAMFGERAHLR